MKQFSSSQMSPPSSRGLSVESRREDWIPRTGRGTSWRKASLIMTTVACITLPAFAFDGRVTVRGLEACNTYADIDALIPFSRGCNSLFYTDLQGKYTSNEDWFAGLGLGYRALYGNQIFGGNLFIDYARSRRDHGFNNDDSNDHHFHSHDYWILSPTLESIHCNWDLRLNGYIPVSHKRSNEGHFFPSGPNACGINGDPRFIQFTGHQQFEHRFLQFEEIGPGVDLSAGINLPFLHCATLRGGVYYYHVDKDADIKPNVIFRDDHKEDITGVAARFDLPINSNWAITSEASYDNQTHGEVAIGLQVQIGHTPTPIISPIVSLPSSALIGSYRAQVPQYVCNGWSCPTLCDRLYDPVYRHIGPIERGTGVPVVHGIKDEGFVLRRDNIWFFSDTGTGTSTTNAGTFENPLANNQLTTTTINDIGNNAILFFNTGTFLINNTPNSILNLLPGQSLFGRTDNFRLSAIGDDRPIIQGGLLLDDPSVHILDSIQLINRGTTDQTITALTLENTTVDICNSLIKAEALVLGDNQETNVAIGIVANNSRAFIDRSEIVADATVAGENLAINAASAIGNFNNNFNNNQFFIDHSVIKSIAQVLSNNLGINLAAAIGNNASTANVSNVTINALFSNNIFTINCSDINNQALIEGNNNSSINSEADIAASLNLATGIGNNVAGVVNSSTNIIVTSNFFNNIFLIEHSDINSLAKILGDNRSTITGGTNNISASFNLATGIGNNVVGIVGINNTGTLLSSAFSNNTFRLNCVTITSAALVAGDNIHTGTITGAFNSATGIGNNRFLQTLTITPAAILQAPFSGNLFLAKSLTTKVNAIIGGDNNGRNTAIGVNADDEGGTASLVVLCDTLFDVTARVGGNNTGTNIATGLLALTNSVIRIFDSIVHVSAFANGNNIANPTVGNVVAVNTIFNTNP